MYEYGGEVITLTVREIAELYPDPKRPRRPLISRANLSHWIGALDSEAHQDWLTDLCFWWWKYKEADKANGG